MMKTKNLFISRSLATNSPFFSFDSKGFNVIGQSLLEFQFIDFNVDGEFDAIFFYSQKAIKHFFSKETYRDEIKYGVMGQKSKEVFLESTQHLPDIIGTGNKKSLGKEIKERWSNANILCPLGKNSVHALESLNLDLSITPLIIYNNTKAKTLDLPACEILIFTSPLNVESYCDHYSLKNKSLFAIGKTTADKIKDYTEQEVFYCEEPSELALFKLVSRQLAV